MSDTVVSMHIGSSYNHREYEIHHAGSCPHKDVKQNITEWPKNISQKDSLLEINNYQWFILINIYIQV